MRSRFELCSSSGKNEYRVEFGNIDPKKEDKCMEVVLTTLAYDIEEAINNAWGIVKLDPKEFDITGVQLTCRPANG